MELVEIMEDRRAPGYVMARDCHLYHTKKDTIVWKNNTETDYTIHFLHDVSPFDKAVYVVPKEGGMVGPLKLKAKAKPKVYSYEIVPAAKSNTMAADPNVIVH